MGGYKTNRRVRLGLEPLPHQQMALQGLMRGRLPSQAALDRMGQLGIKALSLFKPWSTQVDRVLFNGEFFEFADEEADRGEHVFTMGVISVGGLNDVVAWHPATGRLAAWLGLGFALGEYQIADHLDDNSTGLAVYRSPVDWLRAECRGIVIVRHSATPDVLGLVKLLLAQDTYHRAELQKMFPTGSDQPRILLRTEVSEPEAVA